MCKFSKKKLSLIQIFKKLFGKIFLKIILSILAQNLLFLPKKRETAKKLFGPKKLVKYKKHEGPQVSYKKILIDTHIVFYKRVASLNFR